jgi:MFS family permease
MNSTTLKARRILPVIVLSQFLCTTLWFAGNSVIEDMVYELGLQPQFLAHMTSVIQFGFISGTLVYALLSIADRFSPSLVFLISTILAAFFNVIIAWPALPPEGILGLRFLTGFFLAGIYPVGMKIASDHFQQRLGKPLGLLVGALVLGTAFPHLLKGTLTGMPWRYVFAFTSLLALSGGVLLYRLVPDGPFRKPSRQFNIHALTEGFLRPDFRKAAYGYFGHMWELYSFWAFLPLIITTFNAMHPVAVLPVPLLSFLVIASGSVACAYSGWLSQKRDTKNLAAFFLSVSGACCLLSPLLLLVDHPAVFIVFLFIWGMSVVADSPLFSTLVAYAAPETSRGTALTIVNCIGFSITIVSIQVVGLIMNREPGIYIFTLLALGPVFGLLQLYRSR